MDTDKGLNSSSGDDLINRLGGVKNVVMYLPFLFLCRTLPLLLRVLEDMDEVLDVPAVVIVDFSLPEM